MPPPVPLTRTPAPALDFSRPGTPAATDYDDIYFSTDGGLEETRAVFLQGCGLPDRWQGQSVFTIAELGFGSGLNFLATWQAWLDSGATGRLHYISVEGFPLDQDALATALSSFPDLAPQSGPLIQSWPGPVKGVHRRYFGAVTLTLIHDPVDRALSQLRFKADAWFLDGFSPAKNPAMWSEAVLAQVAKNSAAGARLATFTVAGAVRRGLENVGFEVEKKPGFGRKRHRLEARRPGTKRPHKTPPMPTIIGDGIAGASIAHAFARRDLVPNIIHDPDHPAASGNGAALIKPRFDLQDNPPARFFLSSFLYARQAYHAVDAIRHDGVEHRLSGKTDPSRFTKLVGQEPLGPGHLVLRDADLALPTSCVIDTQIARAQFLSRAYVKAQRVERLDAIEGPVILACGYGIRTLLPNHGFRFSRGQLSWTNGRVEGPVTYGGYAIPMAEKILLGASHDRIEDHDQAFSLRPEDDAMNLSQALAQGLDVGPEVTPFRASVRVNSPDTLPRLIKLETEKTRQDVWVLSGLGSRGFVFAPLLGEALVSAYLGEPSPLAADFVARISAIPT
jgi:tRNA 5-methylaminomethyl-2-thiouridine biosynthesis bifunctional protein